MEQTRPASAHVRHFFWIDALRGAAALAVVLYHGFDLLWIGWEPLHAVGAKFSRFDHWAAFLSYPAHFGYSAVMLFFLISGFCIHWPYAVRDRPLHLQPYLLRRLLRIYPPYVAAIALASFLAVFATSSLLHDQMDLSRVMASLAMVQNYAFHHPNYPRYWDMQVAGNSPLWSLPIEAEFYLLYPMLLAVARRWSWGIVTTVVGVISVTALGLVIHWPLMPIPDFVQFWVVWVAGVLLAECTAKGRLPQSRLPWQLGLFTLGVVSLVARPVFHINHGLEFFLWSATYFCLLVLVLQERAEGGQEPRENIGRKIASFLGKISYSLYLTHYPTFSLLLIGWSVFFGQLSSNYLVAFFLSLLAIPVAWVFWRLVEDPSARLAKGVKQR